MKALVSVPEKTAEVKEIAIPVPEEGEILIKVQAVAQNPTDWVSRPVCPLYARD